MVMILVQEKMKKARVGPLPGVTQDIAGFKVRNIQQHRGSDYAVACSLMAKVDCSHVLQTRAGSDSTVILRKKNKKKRVCGSIFIY